jgi:hypothetical protein
MNLRREPARTKDLVNAVDFGEAENKLPFRHIVRMASSDGPRPRSRLLA